MLDEGRTWVWGEGGQDIAPIVLLWMPTVHLPTVPFIPPSSLHIPQGPRTRDLSPVVMDVLCNAPTSILIWPPEEGSTALGQVGCGSAVCI